MKREISVFDYATEIMKALKKGVLITTKAGNEVNSMTISWGSIGIEWNIPIFITFVREGRFTKTLLDKNPEFTVNIPFGNFDKKILTICGSQSGRDIDKIKSLGLSLEEPEVISVPAIKQLPLTLECRVVYKQLQDKMSIPQEYSIYYPQHVDSDNCGANKDFHIAYYAEIVKAYIIE